MNDSEPSVGFNHPGTWDPVCLRKYLSGVWLKWLLKIIGNTLWMLRGIYSQGFVRSRSCLCSLVFPHNLCSVLVVINYSMNSVQIPVWLITAFLFPGYFSLYFFQMREILLDFWLAVVLQYCHEYFTKFLPLYPGHHFWCLALHFVKSLAVSWNQNIKKKKNLWSI